MVRAGERFWLMTRWPENQLAINIFGECAQLWEKESKHLEAWYWKASSSIRDEVIAHRWRIDHHITRSIRIGKLLTNVINNFLYVYGLLASTADFESMLCLKVNLWRAGVGAALVLVALRLSSSHQPSPLEALRSERAALPICATSQ